MSLLQRQAPRGLRVAFGEEEPQHLCMASPRRQVHGTVALGVQGLLARHLLQPLDLVYVILLSLNGTYHKILYTVYSNDTDQSQISIKTASIDSIETSI